MGIAAFFKSVEELADWQKVHARSMSEQERRSRVQIAVIDDESFSAGQNLRNAGYVDGTNYYPTTFYVRIPIRRKVEKKTFRRRLVR